MHKIGEASFVGDQNPHMAAFISLKCDMLVVEELNAIVPEAIKHFPTKKETLLGMLDTLSQRLKKGEFV